MTFESGRPPGLAHEPPQSSAREPWILAATIIASSMAFIDMTVVNVALPVLQRGLGATFAEAQWVVEAYTLFLSALVLAGGTLGDLYGRRRCFALGIAIFALASAACGMAPDPTTLIVARAVQGIGSALLMPGSLAILAAGFPAERRGRAIGLWSAASGVCVAIAPAFGGWLIATFSWRWVFLINLPLAGAALAITWAKLEESRGREGGRLDLSGAALATLSLGGLTFGLIQAERSGFGDFLALGSLVLGFAALGAFCAVERQSRHPMIPLELFRRPAFAGIQVFTFLLWAALQGALFFVPFRLMQVQGFGPLQAGGALLPCVVVISILSRWAGGLADRLGPQRPLVAGALVAGLGFVLLALPGPATPYWLGVLPALLVVGIGMGICVTPVTLTAMNAAGNEHVGAASAINNMVARTGGLLAIALFGLILAQRFGIAFDRSAAGLALPPEMASALAAERAKLAGAVLPAGLSGEQRSLLGSAILAAFVEGYRWVMALAGALAFASAGVAALALGRTQAKLSSKG
jgi:EmrB/QacA subfamily drug resistance transporter